MKIKERLLECKVKEKISSNYKLAKILDCSPQSISELMHDKRKPDAYLAIRIGEVLGIHPLILLAEFEAESAKTTKRKAFWQNFAQRIKTGAVAMLASICIVFWSPDAEAAGQILDTHNA